jgi:hypothetical protein
MEEFNKESKIEEIDVNSLEREFKKGFEYFHTDKHKVKTEALVRVTQNTQRDCFTLFKYLLEIIDKQNEVIRKVNEHDKFFNEDINYMAQDFHERLKKLEPQPKKQDCPCGCDMPTSDEMYYETHHEPPKKKKECDHQWLQYEWENNLQYPGTGEAQVNTGGLIKKLICSKCEEKKDV